MSKVIRYRDVGFDCEGVIHADTEEQVMRQAAEHARTVHGVEVTLEVAAEVRTVMRDEPARA